ncbi:hypothetical protein M0805_008611 [Coniferiporia weirii]|nr:hypothetical protein M0805_008611 [Coniferiporia weirii]
MVAIHVYNGCFIPAGTTMLANVWYVVKDPVECPEPDKFIPERWLTAVGKNLAPLDPRQTTFGFGYQDLSGQDFADSTIFVGVASILAAFNTGKTFDEHGTQITPSVDTPMPPFGTRKPLVESSN